LLLGFYILPSDGKLSFDIRRIDFIGITLFSISIVFFILFLLSLEGDIRYWTIPIFILGFICFYVYENRHPEAFIDVSALKSNKNVLLVYAQFISINLVYYCYFFGLPTFLQQVRKYSEGQTGLIMLAMAGFGVLISPLAGGWIDRSGSKPSVLVGSISLMVGTALIFTIHDTTSLLWILVIMSVLGISNGFNNISMQTSLLRFVQPEKTGSASGLFQTSRYMGAILSSSLLGILFNKQMDVEHFHLIALVCLGFCALNVFFSIRMPGK